MKAAMAERPKTQQEHAIVYKQKLFLVSNMEITMVVSGLLNTEQVLG